MSEARFRIGSVRSAADLAATVALFEAYAASIGTDLSYQDFAGELAAMPGRYAPPSGELLLARDPDGMPLGCVGLRPLSAAGCCEMSGYMSRPGRAASALAGRWSMP